MRHALYTIIFVVCLFPSTSCAQRSIYETVWKAEEYFTDPQMVALCKAIEKEDIPELESVSVSVKDISTSSSIRRNLVTTYIFVFRRSRLDFL